MKKALLIALLPVLACAITPEEIETLLPALEQVESGGRWWVKGDGGNAVGILQIWPIMVEDVNRIAGTSYTLQDRYSPARSREMARIYFRHYGKNWTMEQAARAWNGGPNGHRKEATKIYWEKVKRELDKCK